MSWIEPWDTIEPLVLNDEPLPHILGRASPEIRSILDAALDRHEVTVEEGARVMLGTPGAFEKNNSRVGQVCPVNRSQPFGPRCSWGWKRTL